jgi:NAD-dependent deacetylase
MTMPSHLIKQLASARRAVVLTGAGVSAESGVLTFREAQSGLWAKFKPEQLATPEAFRFDPKRVWEWYAWRRAKLTSVAPNPAHRALAELEQIVPQCVLVTQNVDGLHQRAGSVDVIELHGNITRIKCFEENRVVPVWKDTQEVPPRCPDCGGWLRPDVVWFGEMLPKEAMARATSESENCEVFLSVGTSGLVYPAAMLPYSALEHGAAVVEINPRPSPLTEHVNHVLTGAAGVVLPELVSALKNALGKQGA